MKKLLSTITILASLLFSLMALANDFPKRNISLIVPYSAGGGTDQVARAIAAAAQKIFEKPVTVVNRTGAGGAVGHTAGAKSKPDGYNVTVLTVEVATLPHLGGLQVTYEDFTPIARLNATPSAITVRADSEFNTLEELIQYAKDNPKKLRVGNSGVGAIWHLGAASFAQELGLELNHVPFDGAAPAVAALLGGHIEVVTVSPPEVQAQVDAGNLKILGVMADERVKGFEDTPTLKEQGYDVVVGTWRGLAVPKKTPQDVVDILEKTFLEATKDPEYVEFMTKAGLTMDTLSGKEFKEVVKRDHENFGTLIGNLGLKK